MSDSATATPCPSTPTPTASQEPEAEQHESTGNAVEGVVSGVTSLLNAFEDAGE
jgi:hypothetical protein